MVAAQHCSTTPQGLFLTEPPLYSAPNHRLGSASDPNDDIFPASSFTLIIRDKISAPANHQANMTRRRDDATTGEVVSASEAETVRSEDVAAGIPATGTEKKRAKKVESRLQSSLGVMLGCRLYWLLLLLRLTLCLTLTVIDKTEAMDGADMLAGMLLPESAGGDGKLLKDMMGVGATRGIVGGVLSSGIPYAMWAVITNVLGWESSEGWRWAGLLSVALPRMWMFGLSIIADYFTCMVFRRMEQDAARPALLVMATSWTSLVAMCRPSGFAIEAVCLAGLLAASCGFTVREPGMIFGMSAFFLCTGIFVRPVFAAFFFTPIIYLTSLYVKPGFNWIRYTQGFLFGIAVFAFWATLYATIDSLFYGTCKLYAGGEQVTSIPLFIDFIRRGAKLSYKCNLVYTPLNALKGILSVSFWKKLPTRTSPGQMFLSLPALIGPLFFVLIRDGYDGMKIAMKELMGELKSKKKKKKKKSSQKEKEEDLLVFSDVLQTTLLLGLLLEVMQSNERIGTLSLLALMVPTACCVAKSVFGPTSSSKFRYMHLVYSALAVLLYGLTHQSGVARTMFALSKNELPAIKPNTDIVVYRGMIGHRSILGANRKNITFHDGGDEIKTLMAVIREIKSKKAFREDRLAVLVADTVPKLREGEWERVAGTGGVGHLSILDMPRNLDEAVGKSRWSLLRFLGDEDETEIRDNEERAEEEERREARDEL